MLLQFNIKYTSLIATQTHQTQTKICDPRHGSLNASRLTSRYSYAVVLIEVRQQALWT